MDYYYQKLNVRVVSLAAEQLLKSLVALPKNFQKLTKFENSVRKLKRTSR